MEKSEKKLFIFDDDTTLLALIQRIAMKRFNRIVTSPSARRALELVDEEIQDFDLILTDLNFPDGSGLDILQAAKKKSPLTSVVVFTGYSSLETALRAMHEGAFDYITKPFTLEQIVALINKMESYVDLQRENLMLKKKLENSVLEKDRNTGQYSVLSDELRGIREALQDQAQVLQTIMETLRRRH